MYLKVLFNSFNTHTQTPQTNQNCINESNINMQKFLSTEEIISRTRIASETIQITRSYAYVCRNKNFCCMLKSSAEITKEKKSTLLFEQQERHQCVLVAKAVVNQERHFQYALRRLQAAEKVRGKTSYERAHIALTTHICRN